MAKNTMKNSKNWSVQPRSQQFQAHNIKQTVYGKVTPPYHSTVTSSTYWVSWMNALLLLSNYCVKLVTMKYSVINIFSNSRCLPPSKLLASKLFELLFMRRCCFFLTFGVSAFIDMAVLLLLIGMEDDKLSESISCFSPERNQSHN